MPEDLARIIGKNFSTDSLTALIFFQTTILFQLGVDTNTLMTIIIPDTYFLNWNTSVKNILLRLRMNRKNSGKKITGNKKQLHLI